MEEKSIGDHATVERYKIGERHRYSSTHPVGDIFRLKYLPNAKQSEHCYVAKEDLSRLHMPFAMGEKEVVQGCSYSSSNQKKSVFCLR